MPRHITKHPIKFITLIFVALCFATLGAMMQRTQMPDATILPLWEPDWSPVRLPLSAAAPGVQRDSIGTATVYDIDWDGREELIVGDDQMNILQINPDGTLSNWWRIRIDTFGVTAPRLRLSWIGFANLDGVGPRELLFVSYPDELYIGRRTLPYLPYQTHYELVYSDPIILEGQGVRLFVVDHNADGREDILLLEANAETPCVSVMYGSETGGLLDAVSLVGFDDIPKFAASGSDGIWIVCPDSLWLVKTGSLQAERILEEGGYQIRVEDVDQDNQDELLVNQLESVLVWKLGMGGWERSEEISFPYEIRDLGVGDFDGDGLADLVVRQVSGFEYVVLPQRQGRFGDAAITYGVPIREPMLAAVRHLLVGDFDGDGTDDIAHTARGNDVGVALSSSEVSGTALQPLPGSMVLGTHGTDVLCSAPFGGIAVLGDSGTGGYQVQTIINAPSFVSRSTTWTPYAAGIADITQASGEEFCAMGFTSRGAQICVWEFDGTDWIEAFYCAIDEGIRPQLVLADIDNDGLREMMVGGSRRLAVCEGRRNSNDEWYASGQVEWIEWGGEVGPMAAIQSPDGREDLVGIMASEEGLFLKLLRGTQVRTLVALGPGVPLDLQVDDVNGDGIDDIVIAGLIVVVEDEIAWLSLAIGYWLGNASGNYAGEFVSVPGLPFDTLIYPYGGLATGDFDGDGRKDIALLSLGEALGSGAGKGLRVYAFDGETFDSLYTSEGMTGTKLFAVDVNADAQEELVHATTGMNPWLAITRLKRGE